MNNSCSSFFPHAADYAGLRQAQSSAVRERLPDDNLFPYTERHLQCVWCDASLRPAALRSVTGESVAVEDPGRWNLEAGPDFLGAALKVGPEQRRLAGDVEIHVRPGDWHTHGHAGDPLYANVIAHVSYFPGSVAAALLPPRTVQIAIKDALAADPSFSFESIDPTAYPYAALPAQPTPCAQVLAAWPPARRGALLEAAGEERLRTKAARMGAAIGELGSDQVLYEELMTALGYKHNRAAFRQLARRLPLAALDEECGGNALAAYALLCGVAGLMPSQISPRWDGETRAFVRKLWDLWWQRKSKWEEMAMPRQAWRTGNLRPQNQPVRRLAAAAGLFTGRPPLAQRLASLRTDPPEAWLTEAAAVLGSPADIPYWNRRLGFSGAPRPADEALIGKRRIAAILSNVITPFLAAAGAAVVPLLNHLPPEEDNSLIRHTAFALFGRDHNPSLYAQGLRQQGILQIFHDFCLSRAGCRACRLATSLASFADTRA